MRSESILIVEDEKLLRWALKEELSKLGFEVFEATSKKEALTTVASRTPDLILLDQLLPDGSGLEVLGALKNHGVKFPVIMLTAVDRSDVAVQAMKLGAIDYLVKPVNIEELAVVINKALEDIRVKRHLALVLKEREESGFRHIVGSSQAIRKAKALISRYAPSKSTTVLITGESGTGKELAARAIHQLSPRHEEVFLTVNCSALTESLIESELFGHEKGSFTDASSQRKGIFEVANKGTVLLDEIGNMSLGAQTKLLRVLEQKTIRRVGGTTDIGIDVRVIAATNQELEKRIDDGLFRADLFYRLNVARLHMPAIRDRAEDIVLLAELFLAEFNQKFHKQFKGLSEETKLLFESYHWPGNVREIRNVIERAALLDDGDYIFSHHVSLGHLHELSDPRDDKPSSEKAELPSLPEMEKKALLEALERTAYNQTKAAQLLKISRYTLRYRMKKFGLLKSENPSIL
jgi:two-component system response regulator AtoC